METTIKKKILCVGECVVDVIHVCSQFPVEDSDSRSNHGRWQRGGNASNNCTILANLGENCELLSTFSNYEMFKFVLHDLKERKIDTSHCHFYENCEVPLSTVLLSAVSGSRTIVHSNPNLPDVQFEHFDKCDLNDYKLIHFQARCPVETSKMMKKIVEWNKNHAKIVISLDLEKVKKENSSLVQYADYVFLGKDYANFIGADDMKAGVYKLKEIFTNPFTVICPWGSHGVAALDTDMNYYEARAYPPEKVIDTLGAGDTFCAACLFYLMNGKSLPESLDFASKVAGCKVGGYGYDIIKGKFSS